MKQVNKKPQRAVDMREVKKDVFVVDNKPSLASVAILVVLMAGSWRLGQAIALEVNPLPMRSTRNAIERTVKKVL